MLSFAGLVLSMAVLPFALPHRWERLSFQVFVVAVFTLPIAAFLGLNHFQAELLRGVAGYISFSVTLGALYITAGGVFVEADFAPTPRANVALLLLGSLLASVIGTT